MSILKLLGIKLNDFRRDTKGSFAMVWGAYIMVLFTVVGMLVDMSLFFNQRQKSTSITDSVALAAAIYIKEHKAIPVRDGDGFIHNKPYDISDIFTEGQDDFSGIEEAKVTVRYNDKKREITVDLNGAYKPKFLSAVGKDRMEFKTQSISKYPEKNLAPASVALIVDISMSMELFDKPAGKKGKRAPGSTERSVASRKAVEKFNNNILDKLKETYGNNKNDYEKKNRVMRMALVPFAGGVVKKAVRNPQWKVFSDKEIIQMKKLEVKTNSTEAFELVHSMMKNELAVHKKVNSRVTPKRIVVFMTDGANQTQTKCGPWKKLNLKGWWHRKRNGAYENNKATKALGNGWSRGKMVRDCKLVSSANDKSLALCKKLKNEGAEIYTVGFAIEPGTYIRSKYNPNLAGQVKVTKEESDLAKSLLRGCASSRQHFILAKDSSSLNHAFDQISKNVSYEVVRISG